MKKIFDIFSAILLTLFLMPIIIIVALLVKITSKGSVFHRPKFWHTKDFAIFTNPIRPIKN